MTLDCAILFNENPNGVYLSGQLLSGRVELNLEKPKKLKGICLYIDGASVCKWSEIKSQRNSLYLRHQGVEYSGRKTYLYSIYYIVPFNADGVHITIVGQARARWNEHQRYFDRGRPKTKEIFYQADETYLDTKAYLKKGLESNNNESGGLVELPKGQHVYTFACALPPMLPTSFEGSYGHIRYTVKVVLERPWKFDQTFKVAFTVLKELDLNLLSPILRIPTHMETATNFWCGPCTSGTFSMVAIIPQSGYVAGQVIDIVAEVTNMTSIPVDYIKCSLRKVVLYRSQQPLSKTKVEFDIVQERRSGHVEKMSHGRFPIQLAIPPIPPTTISLCKVIEITYEIKVEAKVAGPHNNPSVIIPVTIGTVPLQQSPPHQPSIRTTDAITEQPQLNQLPILPAESNDIILQPIRTTLENGQNQPIVDLPPPSYEESQNGNIKIEDDEEEHPIRQQPYTPIYQVYRSAPIMSTSNIESTPPTEAETTQPTHAMKLQEKIESWQ